MLTHRTMQLFAKIVPFPRSRNGQLKFKVRFCSSRAHENACLEVWVLHRTVWICHIMWYFLLRSSVIFATEHFPHVPSFPADTSESCGCILWFRKRCQFELFSPIPLLSSRHYRYGHVLREDSWQPAEHTPSWPSSFSPFSQLQSANWSLPPDWKYYIYWTP